MPKILVIDDNKDYLVILKDVLSTYKPDYEVLTVQSGKEGIKLAEIEKPDTILLDIKMPEMDGYEVCRQLKQDEELSHIPIVFLTGVKLDLQDRIKGLELGGDAYLYKPVNTEELIAQIEVMLRIKKAEDRLLLEKESLEEKVIERTKDLENVIIKLKKSEEVLHVERDNLKNIFEAMKDGVYIVDQQYYIQYVNPVLVQDFGDYEGQKCYEYFHDRKEVCPWCKNHEVFTGKTVRWEWYSLKSKRTYDLIDTPLKNPDGSISKLEIFRDITERKQTEQALQERKQLLSNVFESMQEGVVVLTTDFKYTYWNKRMEDISLTKREEVLGRIPWEKFPFLKGRISKAMKKAMSGDISRNIELNYTLSDGKEGWTTESYFPLKDSDAKIIGIIGVIEDITERKQAQEALLLSEEKFRTLFEESRDPIYITSRDGEIIDQNKAWCDLFGYTKEEFNKINAVDLFSNTTDRKQFQTEMAEKGHVKDLEIKYRKKDGMEIICLETATVRRDSAGKIIGYQGIIRDITERKLMADALEESEQRYSNVVDNLDEVLFQTDIDGRWLFLNPAWTKITGYSVEDSIGQVFLDYVYPEDRERNVELFKPLIEGKKDFCRHEIRYRTKDNGIRWIDVFGRLTFDSSNEISGTIGTLLDITERKQAEELLYKREQEFRTIVENAPDVISRFDREFRHIYINPAIEKESGMPREYFIGKTNTELGTPEDVVIQWHDAIKSVFETGEEITVYTEIPTPDGKRYYSNRIAPEFAADGSVKSVLNITRNITERKLAEEALRESEALFRTILYSIGDAVITTEKLGIIQHMNIVAEDLTGWSEQDAAGQPLKKIFRIINEESRRKVENPVERVLREGVVLGLANHTLLISRNGKEIPIADAGAPIKDDKGEITGVVLVFRDQTEEREAQRALEEARAYAEGIIITVREPLLVLDKKLKVISTNRSFYQNFMTDESETVGKYIYDLGNRQWDIPELRKLLEGILPQNTSFNDFEVKLAFEQIGTRTLLLNARRIYREAEKTQQILLAIEDITERKQADEALRESEEKYRLIVENAHDGIEITQDDQFIFTNPRFAEMLGYTVDELKNIPFNRIFTEQATQELYERKQRRQAGKTVPHQYKTTMLKKDGTVIDVDVKYEIIDYNEKPATFAIVRDITERKQAEEELKQKMEQLDRANKLMIGRELKMIELKREINTLLGKVGQPKKYSAPEEVD